MKLSIAVYASPKTPGVALSALRFAEAVLQQGHEIYRLFFFNEGVLNGVALGDEGGESSLLEGWKQVIARHRIDAVICVTSAKKRGIAEGPVAGAAGLVLAEGFTIGGLGQLIDAAVTSDRLITFGN